MVKIIKGIIDRRILVNYRLDPIHLSKILPKPFKPRIFNGYALGGICLIRFAKMRPTWLPKFLGTTSENGTHRFCVEWESDGLKKTGIYVMQRFTNSKLHEFGGGRIFPGNLIYSQFSVKEGDSQYHVSFRSSDNDNVDILVKESSDFPKSSIFSSLVEASKFYENDDVGYSPTESKSNYQGVKLNTKNWQVTPLKVISATSSLFSNEEYFPKGSAVIDHSLLMKDIKHDWQVVNQVCCE